MLERLWIGPDNGPVRYAAAQKRSVKPRMPTAERKSPAAILVATAALLGASREAVNKQLRALAKEGGLVMDGHQIRVMKQPAL